MIDEIPMGGAGAVPDFTPFFQRAKDKKPDVFFVFVPAGDHAAAVVKTYAALGMREAGIKLIGPGDITQDTKLQAMGDGRGRPHHHAPLQRRSRQPREQALRRGVEEGVRRQLDARLHGGGRLRRHGGDRPRRCRRSRARSTVDEALEALKGWKFNSPRGPIMIDPVTRDIVMNEYLSEVGEGNGRQAAPEGDRQDRGREGRLQGA